MMRITLAVALVIALAMSAGAYDELYSNDTAATHYAGDFGIDVSFLYFMGNSSYDKDGESYDPRDGEEYTGMWFPVDIYYGVMDGWPRIPSSPARASATPGSGRSTGSCRIPW
jgi:hypothetical protein